MNRLLEANLLSGLIAKKPTQIFKSVLPRTSASRLQEYHADCEEVLLEDGSQQEDIWGADWYPESKTVQFVALINIRPRQGNRGMEIEDPKLREKVETIVRRLLEMKSK